MSPAAGNGRPARPSTARVGRVGAFDPEQYRMSVGDHLDELRSRLIKALIGAGVAFFGCLIVAKNLILPFVAAPAIRELRNAGQPPYMFFTDVTGPFFVYLKLAMIGAFVIASPWVLYQAWAFVAAGLYPNERRQVTKYLPGSVLLFFSGVAFTWFIVIPLTLRFFLAWSISIPLPEDARPPVVPDADGVPGMVLPVMPGDPAVPVEGQVWIDSTTGTFRAYLDGRTRSLQFGAENLIAPILTLPQYVNLVLLLVVASGVAFQIPLVVMALIRAGIVRPEVLRQYRRHVYFVLVIFGCVITPGDVIIANLTLIPVLMVLYELGLWLGTRGTKATAQVAGPGRS